MTRYVLWFLLFQYNLYVYIAYMVFIVGLVVDVYSSGNMCAQHRPHKNCAYALSTVLPVFLSVQYFLLVVVLDFSLL